MSFIRNNNIPQIDEGQTLLATIKNIEYPIKPPQNSKYPQKDQIQFGLQLDDGYNFKSWIPYYEHPHQKSKLGKLCLKLIETTKQEYNTVDEALTALKEFGRILVQCNGHQEFNGQQYPILRIVVDRLPGKQTSLHDKQPLTKQQVEELIRKMKEEGHLNDDKKQE